MAGNNKITIDIDVNQQQAVNNINVFNQTVNKIGPTVQKNSQQAQQGLSSLQRQAQQMQRQLSTIATGFAAFGFARLGGDLLQAAADMDTLRKSLTTIEGSLAGANARFAELQELAKRPGLELEPTIQGFIRLRNAGMDAREAKETLEGIGNALGRMGMGGTELSRVMEQVGQSLGKSGGVMREDLKFIQQIVPEITTIMQKMFGTTDTQAAAIKNLPAIEFWRRIVPELRKLESAEPGIKKTMETFSTGLKQLKADVGAAIAETLTPQVEMLLAKFQEWRKEWKSLDQGTRDAIVLFAEAAIGITAMATALLAVAEALGAIRAAALLIAANPVILGILGIAAIGYQLYENDRRLKQMYAENDLLQKRKQILDEIAGGMSREKLLEKGYTVEQIKEAMAGGSVKPQQYFTDLYGIRVLKPGEKGTPGAAGDDKEAARQAKDMAKHIAQAQRDAANNLRDAYVDRSKMFAEFAQGEDKVAADIEALKAEMDKRNQRTLTWVDSKGVERQLKASAQTLASWEQEFNVRAQTIRDKARFERQQKEADAAKEVMDTWFDAYNKIEAHRREVSFQSFDEMEKAQIESIRERRQIEDQLRMEAIEHRREMELEALEGMEARTLQQQLELNEKRLEIEIRYIDAVLEERKRLLDFERDRALLEMRSRVIASQPFEAKRILESPEYKSIEQSITDLYDKRKEALETSAAQQREMARLKAVSDQSKMVRSEMQKTFDYFQRLGEGVFDALLDKSKSVWQTMADFFKMTVLTMLKSIFTSMIANSMMRLFFGAQGAAAGPRVQARTGGGLGSIFGNLFGGGGGGGGTFGFDGWLQRIVGGPGGTGGFAGPVSFGGRGVLPVSPGATTLNQLSQDKLGRLVMWEAQQRMGMGGGAGNAGGLASMLGLGGFFNSGSIAMGGYSTTAAGIGGIGGSLAGFASSPGGIGLGGLLAFMGLKRGGFLGGAMATGGGALAGFGIGAMIGSVGGPLGMAIGAAIGASAGFIRSLFKTATEKTQIRIKQIYGVDITSKQILNQITQIVKTQYGGDMNVGLYSPQVQEIVRLYAMTQGVSPTGMGRPMYPVSFSLSQGSANLQPVYSGGMLVSNPYVGTTTTEIAAAHSPTPAVFAQIDPVAANNLLEGRVVQIVANNGPVVADAATGSMDATYRRSRDRNSLMEPLTLMG